ncbi:uncharacterized protein TNCV_95321 [Trichonephila clavipes]|nr:uncharacterized protein TNCV_95321 [Trichonephila clavipes]
MVNQERNKTEMDKGQQMLKKAFFRASGGMERHEAHRRFAHQIIFRHSLHQNHIATILRGAVGILVVRASDSRPEGLGSMLDVTKYPPSAHGFTCRNCGGGDRGRVAIYRPFGEVSLSLNRTVTCMVLKANDRRTSCPCHDEFRGPRSDYVRQVALATTTTQHIVRRKKPMFDAEIIVGVTVNEKMPKKDEDVYVANTTQTHKISNSEGLKAIEIILQYFEQQSASVMDLLFFCRFSVKACCSMPSASQATNR